MDKLIPTVIVGSIVAAVFVAIIVNEIRKKKKGISSCGCGCENCASAGMCHPKKK